MSAWRLVVADLYAHGGSAHVNELTAADYYQSLAALQQAMTYGLVTSTASGRRGGSRYREQAVYALTPKGIGLMEHRVACIRRPDSRWGTKTKRMLWVATWLESLPRGLRIKQQAAALKDAANTKDPTCVK